MNWKCKFGFHDWEILFSIGSEKLKWTTLHPEGPSLWFDGDTIAKYKRICLRPDCKKYEDTITPFVTQVHAEEQVKQDRKKLALETAKNYTDHRSDI